MRHNSVFGRAVKLTRPFRSLSHEASIAFLVTASKLKWDIEVAVHKEGISSKQFNVLRILRGAAEPVPTMEISRRLIDHEPGITKLLNRLEQKGLVSRSRNPKDTRQVLCKITASGQRTLSRLDSPVADLEEDFFQIIPEDRLRDLIGVLEIIQTRSGRIHDQT